MRKFFLLTALVGLVFACFGAQLAGAEAQPKVTICHASGLDGTTKFETLTIAYPAVYGEAGHFYENGTPRAGHEQDYLGPCLTPETTTSTSTASTTTVEQSTTTSSSVEPSTTTTLAPSTTTTFHDNRCDDQHPDEGNDEQGHNNPSCDTTSTTSTTEASTTSTSSPETTTTEAPTSSTSVFRSAATTTAPGVTPAPAGQVVARPADLPRTGNDPWLAQLGLALFGIGGLGLAFSRRRAEV